MNLDDLISRATHTSGRSLLALSGVVILASRYNHQLGDFPILATAKEMPDGMIEAAACSMILFMLIAHGLNWFTDKTAFEQGELVKIYNKQKQLDQPGDFVESGEEIKPYKKLIQNFKKEITLTTYTQKVSLWGQHLIFPVATGIFALNLLVCKIWA